MNILATITGRGGERIGLGKYTAEIDSVGDWDGAEQEAVNCWNEYVSPALWELHDALEDNENFLDPSFTRNHVEKMAWEWFCDTTDEESFQKLGKRVAAAIRAEIL